MLHSLNDRDKVFRQSRVLTIICVIGMAAVSLFSMSYVYSGMREQSQVVYALIGEDAVQLGAVDVLDNRPVEAHSHVKLFHRHLFQLDPDREVIDRNINAALSISDNSVQALVDTYEEDSYYRNLITGNISQTIETDSIQLDMSLDPYYFKYIGTLTITRPTSTLTRSLVSEGYFRNVQRSKLNPHGFLIEQFRILENEDLRVEKRYN